MHPLSIRCLRITSIPTSITTDSEIAESLSSRGGVNVLIQYTCNWRTTEMAKASLTEFQQAIRPALDGGESFRSAGLPSQ